MSFGIGSNASLGVVTEVTYGENPPAVPSMYLPIKSETLKATRESVESTALNGRRMLSNVALGIHETAGGFTLVNDAQSIGQPLFYWNGALGYTSANTNSLTMFIIATPTAVAGGAGGTLPTGTYIYKVATILNRTVDNLKLICPATASSAPVAVVLGDQVTISWPDPTLLTPPVGFTYYGTAIYRTAAGGAAGTEKYLKTVVGTALNTLNDTPLALTTTVSPFTGTVHRHRFIGSTPPPGVDAVPSFSVTINKDNEDGLAEAYIGCRMNEFNLSAAGGNDEMEATFGLLARTVVPRAATVPSLVDLEPILGWKAAGFIDNSASCEVLEGFELNCTNNSEQEPGFCATPYNFGVLTGKRVITGSFQRTYRNQDFFQKVQTGAEFGLKLNAYGQPITPLGATITLDAVNGVYAFPFTYFMEIELFKCRTGDAGGNVGGPGRISETVNFKAFYDSTQLTEMRISLYNTIPAYA